MPTARNIPVAASPEPCRQTRRLATGYGAALTERCRFPLLVLPGAVNQARSSGGCLQFARARSLRDQAVKMSAQKQTISPDSPENKDQKPVCIPVKRG
jgi:hypothetical protein